MVAIKLNEVFEILESSYELLVVTDASEKVIHASRLFLNECKCDKKDCIGKKLSEVLTEDSYRFVKDTLKIVKDGQRGSTIFTTATDPACSIALKARYSESDGGLYIFYASYIDELKAFSQTEQQERIKELSCLYAISEWIEVSDSVKEFFTELPNYLAPGMQYPEYALVYSIYQDFEYGQKFKTENFIKADLWVNKELRGEIRVGYMDDKIPFLPEEQKMLREIARMLNLALDRKEFSESLEQVRKEIDERTTQIEEQRKKLNTVNSYLSKINRDWDESRIRLETMFQAIPDQVAIIDLKRNVIMTNRGDVAPGKKCHKTFFNSDVPCQDCRLMRIIREKTPITLEIKRDDEFFEVHALPIFNPDHEVEGIIEFYRNITKEKIYEQQLQQADKLASLGQLVSGIGHEINNPNQFIKGNIKIVEQALDDMLPIVDEYYKTHPDLKIARLKYDFFREHIMTLVKDMSHGSQRIKGIVEGLRRFARRDEGLLIDNVDLNTIIDESARLVHNQIHKYADIKLNLDSRIPTITGNAQKIEQVIINLLINAGQAMPEGKKGEINISTMEEHGYVVIEVVDNASGMSEQTLKHIFDPFFTTKRAKGGTGLGLSIAYRIIEEHRGSIAVSSKVGVGTTFVIRFPIRKNNAETEISS